MRIARDSVLGLLVGRVCLPMLRHIPPGLADGTVGGLGRFASSEYSVSWSSSEGKQ